MTVQRAARRIQIVVRANRGMRCMLHPVLAVDHGAAHLGPGSGCRWRSWPWRRWGSQPGMNTMRLPIARGRGLFGIGGPTGHDQHEQAVELASAGGQLIEIVGDAQQFDAAAVGDRVAGTGDAVPLTHRSARNRRRPRPSPRAYRPGPGRGVVFVGQAAAGDQGDFFGRS